MKLTICNGTDNNLSFHPTSDSSFSSLKVPPNSTRTTVGFGIRTTVLLAICEEEKADTSSVDISNVPVTTFHLKLGAQYKAVSVPQDCPWRIYRSKISKRHYKLSVFPRRDLASFLSEMPDSLPLSSLLLPGTHDTMALYGWPISQCQSPSTPLAVQLNSGIRVLDIRLAVIDGLLIAYHGIYPQRTPFQEILATIHDFLTAPATSREALVMSIKQEDFKKTPLPLFSKCVHDEIMNGPGGRTMWFLENRIPNLGEVRGKVVMLSRFGGDGSEWENGLEGLGIHPTAWPDSEKDGFTWTLKGTLVRTHDWYNISSFLSIPEKTKLATEILLPAPDNPSCPVLNITYTSAASIPLACPPTVARGFGWPKWGLGVEGVNGRVGKWLLDQLSNDQAGTGMLAENDGEEDVRIRGWVFMDFYPEPENTLTPLLVECNYRGRKKGEEGWNLD